MRTACPLFRGVQAHTTNVRHTVTYVDDHPDGVTIRVRVIPRSSRNAVKGVIGNVLGIKLTAPPVEGKANRALLKFLGKKLGVAQSTIALVHGRNSREKTLLDTGVDRDIVKESLE